MKLHSGIREEKQQEKHGRYTHEQTQATIPPPSPKPPVTLPESASWTLQEDLSPLVILICDILTVFLKGNVSVRIQSQSSW